MRSSSMAASKLENRLNVRSQFFLVHGSNDIIFLMLTAAKQFLRVESAKTYLKKKYHSKIRFY